MAYSCHDRVYIKNIALKLEQSLATCILVVLLDNLASVWVEEWMMHCPTYGIESG